MLKKVQKIEKETLKKISQVKNLKGLNDLWSYYLGPKGQLKILLKGLKAMPAAKRRQLGPQIQRSINSLEQVFEQKKRQLTRQFLAYKHQQEKIDVTLPGLSFQRGHFHPLTQVLQEVVQVFSSLGFETVEGPEIETEYYNFDALNIPPFHPARDLWDTFFLSEGLAPVRTEGKAPAPSRQMSPQELNKLLLRTHTSPVQVRYMEKHTPPFRIIVPGRCFRYENPDSQHDIQFHQLEGLMVGKNISIAHFKGIIEEFFQRLFPQKKKDLSKPFIRLRPSYFPFTEPSCEVDLWYQGSYLEMAGAGMVHPKVFEAAGYVPGQWQGFAFGLGLDRLCMVKFGLPDIRLLYQGDLRILRQF